MSNAFLFSQQLAAIFPFVLIPYRSWLMAADKTIKKRPYSTQKSDFTTITWYAVEPLQVNWLIEQFNGWFADKNTILVKGEHEPEYFAATDSEPARIVFAHGFFASSLHEISHWCVAGKRRRALNDFVYWYTPDGRDERQQTTFEQVEIVPQAIECLLTLACGQRFRVSQDNLSANFDTSTSTFAKDVCAQAIAFWQTGEKLPSDAKFLIQQLQPLRPYPITTMSIAHNFLQF